MTTKNQKNKKQKKSNSLVYVPDGAAVNSTQNSMSDPKTEYENRRYEFDQDSVRKLVGGLYGARND